MLTSFSKITNRVSNVIVPLKIRIAAIPCIAGSIQNNSRLNKAGFFIAADERQPAFVAQRLQVRVFDYQALSLLRKAANSTIELLNKLYN